MIPLYVLNCLYCGVPGEHIEFSVIEAAGNTINEEEEHRTRIRNVGFIIFVNMLYTHIIFESVS